MVVLNVVDGSVRKGRRCDVMRAIASANSFAVSAALELAVDAKLEVPECVLRRRFSRLDQPLSVRLRAAVALANSDDFRGRMLVRRSLEDVCQAAETASRAGCCDADDREFVLRHLRAVLGKDAIPLFVKELSQVGDIPSVEQGLAGFGSSAVPALKQAMTSDNWLTRVRAAQILGTIGPDAGDAIQVLQRASKDPDPEIRKSAIMALRRIQAKGHAK